MVFCPGFVYFTICIHILLCKYHQLQNFTFKIFIKVWGTITFRRKDFFPKMFREQHIATFEFQLKTFRSVSYTEWYFGFVIHQYFCLRESTKLFIYASYSWSTTITQLWIIRCRDVIQYIPVKYTSSLYVWYIISHGLSFSIGLGNGLRLVRHHYLNQWWRSPLTYVQASINLPGVMPL